MLNHADIILIGILLIIALFISGYQMGNQHIE